MKKAGVTNVAVTKVWMSLFHSRISLVIASPPNLIKQYMTLLRGNEHNDNQLAVVTGMLVMSDQRVSQVIAWGWKPWRNIAGFGNRASASFRATCLPGQALKNCRNLFFRRSNLLELVPVHCTSVLFISFYQGRCVCFIVF